MNIKRLDKYNREQVAKRRDGEGRIMKQLLDEGHLNETYPFLFAYEYDIVENRTEYGKGDLLFCDHTYNKFLVVECKYLDHMSTGRTQCTKRNKHKKELKKQVEYYVESVPMMLRSRYGIRQCQIEGQMCYNSSDGSLNLTYPDGHHEEYQPDGVYHHHTEYKQDNYPRETTIVEESNNSSWGTWVMAGIAAAAIGYTAYRSTTSAQSNHDSDDE